MSKLKYLLIFAVFVSVLSTLPLVAQSKESSISLTHSCADPSTDEDCLASVESNWIGLSSLSERLIYDSAICAERVIMDIDSDEYNPNFNPNKPKQESRRLKKTQPGAIDLKQNYEKVKRLMKQKDVLEAQYPSQDALLAGQEYFLQAYEDLKDSAEWLYDTFRRDPSCRGKDASQAQKESLAIAKGLCCSKVEQVQGFEIPTMNCHKSCGPDCKLMANSEFSALPACRSDDDPLRKEVLESCCVKMLDAGGIEIPDLQCDSNCDGRCEKAAEQKYFNDLEICQ